MTKMRDMGVHMDVVNGGWGGAEGTHHARKGMDIKYLVYGHRPSLSFLFLRETRPSTALDMGTQYP